MSRSKILLFLGLALLTQPCAAQAPKSRAEERSLPKFEKSLFFTIPPRKQARKHPLLVVMPGGPGTRDFLPFIENGILGAAPKDCVGVMVTAAQWNKDQKIVWASKDLKVQGMQWTTEDHVAAIVADVKKQYSIDDKRITLLAWSSSGPVAYRMMADAKLPFERAYIAMSVWPKLKYKQLKAVKKRRFVLDQSPEDQVTLFGQCRLAFNMLNAAGAKVQLSTYSGGHGWRDGPIPRLNKNLTWLFGNAKPAKPVWPKIGPAKADAAGNVLNNPGFEQGTNGWRVIGNSGRFSAKAVTNEKVDGKQALYLKKTGSIPMDLVTQNIRIGKGKKISFSMQAKWKGCKNGWLKVWLYDENNKAVNKDVNVAHFLGDNDWEKFEQTWPADGVAMVQVQLLMVHGGEVWLDAGELKVLDK